MELKLDWLMWIIFGGRWCLSEVGEGVLLFGLVFILWVVCLIKREYLFCWYGWLVCLFWLRMLGDVSGCFLLFWSIWWMLMFLEYLVWIVVMFFGKFLFCMMNCYFFLLLLIIVRVRLSLRFWSWLLILIWCLKVERWLRIIR